MWAIGRLFSVVGACFAKLPLPLHRKRLHKPRQRYPLRLSPVQNRLDYIRREQLEQQEAGEVGRTDFHARGKNGSDGRGSVTTTDIPGTS